MTPEKPRAEWFSLLGLAQRAGALVRGTDAVRQAMRAGRVHLVVTADDASAAQLAKIEGLLHQRGIPRVVSDSRARLGAALGVAPVSAVGVTDRGWAHRLQRKPGATASRD